MNDFLDTINEIPESKSKTFVAVCVSFLIGVFVACFFPPLHGSIYWLAGLAVAALSIILMWENVPERFVVLCLTFIFLGLWRMSVAWPDCGNGNTICSYVNQRITIAGSVASYPEQKTDSVDFAVAVLGIREPSIRSVSGKVLVSLPKTQTVSYGQSLTLTCRIRVPEVRPGDTFNYNRYLQSRGIQALCDSPGDITWADGREVPFAWRTFFMKQIASLRDLLYHRASQLWNEPESSFIMGMLFGGSSSLPAYVQESFQRTGLSHVLAVSGFNVTIIASALMGLLVLVGLWRHQAFWITISGIVFFVILTGATASVVRASIMGILVLTADHLGRRAHIAPALAVTALAMVLVNPYLLVYDAGFQLSFLATVGLVYLAPRIAAALPKRTPEAFTTTVAAIGMTLPLMLYQFGLMSLVAPLVNVLLLWSVPFLMLGSFVALGIGLLVLPAGVVAGMPAAFASRVFITIVQWFSSLRFAAVNISIPWWAVAVAYAVLAVSVLNYRPRKRRA